MNYYDYRDGIAWEWDEIIRYNIQSDYGGWFHVYAFTMTMGVLISILCAAIKMKIRRLPLTDLMLLAVIVVPCGLLGASVVGKINKSDATDFWSYFAFWHGGMAIHGAIWTSLVIGLIVLYFLGRYKTKISIFVFADCIAPNILLGQAIGRWGNFFNHELHGYPLANLTTNPNANPLWWLPKFITENTQFVYDGQHRWYHGIELIQGNLYQTEPIFLYESFGLVMAWILITFVLPGFGRWISKKPWKIYPDTYTLDLDYSWKVFFNPKKYREENKMTYWEIWNDAFYWTYDEEAYQDYLKYYNEHIKGQKYTIVKRWQNCSKLLRANNPNKYCVIKCGVELGAYFLSWNIVRFVLELRRCEQDALIQNASTASLIIVGVSMIIGLLIIIFCQFLFPRLFRTTGYRYEKEYFFIKN